MWSRHEHSSTLTHTLSAVDVLICQAWSGGSEQQEAAARCMQRKRAASRGLGAAEAQFVAAGTYQSECLSTGKSSVSRGQPLEVPPRLVDNQVPAI